MKTGWFIDCGTEEEGAYGEYRWNAFFQGDTGIAAEGTAWFATEEAALDFYKPLLKGDWID